MLIALRISGGTHIERCKTMNYLNEYHKVTVKRKLRKMAQWRKSPIGCEEAIKQAQLNVTGTNFHHPHTD